MRTEGTATFLQIVGQRSTPYRKSRRRPRSALHRWVLPRTDRGLRRLARVASVSNGALLLASMPASLTQVNGIAALRAALLSGWLSGFGLLLLLREVPAPLVQRWLRRHFRFVTTTSGRTTLRLFAATVGLATVQWYGSVVALATLANEWLSRTVSRLVPPPSRRRAQQRLSAGPTGGRRERRGRGAATAAAAGDVGSEAQDDARGREREVGS